MNAVLYIHGKNGSADEAGHYRPFFPGSKVVGLDYRTFTPWETGQEIREAAEALEKEHGKLTLIANSIGAFFSMHAHIESLVQRALFISPIVDMEKLIRGMMAWANVTEEELRERRVIHTSFGEDLSWEYLCWAREHPIRWDAPTEILYGGQDALTSRETVTDFVRKHNAGLTVMEDGEHWFHTDEQLLFLDGWLRDCLFSSSATEPTGSMTGGGNSR